MRQEVDDGSSILKRKGCFWICSDTNAAEDDSNPPSSGGTKEAPRPKFSVYERSVKTVLVVALE
jgi:hypothetical protein